MNHAFRTLTCLIALVLVQAAFADKPRFGDTLTVGLGGMSHRGKATLAATRPDAPIGARLSTDFEMQLYIADLTWDFLKTENGHLGAGLGLHAVARVR